MSAKSSLISLEGVSVNFRIYSNPLPSLKEFFLNRVSNDGARDLFREFHGLNNVDLKVEPGDRLGVIGLNGAGKSTLLKTIAGIYTPHQGALIVNGRITPLMELGAGFDPEQTGRENIYLNGALLGFSPKEMKQREEAIVEFSELKEFLDLPLKYYSTGMYGRLAFAIATATPSDILLIDEVFAAGDAHFVKKSENRILNLVNESQIVMIVTHSFNQIENLCNRVIVMDRGRVVNDGEPRAMIDFYRQNIVDMVGKK